jgi:hypothetical protein
VITRFPRYQDIWPCDLDISIWPTYLFRLRYFTWVLLVTKAFHGYQKIDLSIGYIFWKVFTRTLAFHLSVPCFKKHLYLDENFNSGYNFKLVCLRTLIFHIGVPWTTDLTLWPWPWYLIYLLKTLLLAISFERYSRGLWHFIWVFLVKKKLPVDMQIFLSWTWSLTFVLKV